MNRIVPYVRPFPVPNVTIFYMCYLGGYKIVTYIMNLCCFIVNSVYVTQKIVIVHTN